MFPLLATIVTTGDAAGPVLMSSPDVNAAATNAATNMPIAEGATRMGADAASFLSGINWSSPSWDLFIVLFFVAAVFLYGISLGREKVIVILVSIYMALAVVTNAPYVRDLDKTWSVGSFFAFKTLLFLGTFSLLFFLMGKSALARTFGGLAAAKWWQVMLFSVFHVGLLVSITLSFLPPDAVAHLSPVTREVFASDTARFLWIVLPIAAMLLVKSEESK